MLKKIQKSCDFHQNNTFFAPYMVRRFSTGFMAAWPSLPRAGRLCTSRYVYVSNAVHLYIEWCISKRDFMELTNFYIFFLYLKSIRWCWCKHLTIFKFVGFQFISKKLCTLMLSFFFKNYVIYYKLNKLYAFLQSF